MKDRIRASLLASIRVKEEILKDPQLISQIEQVAKLCIQTYQNGNKILIAGNGGSAADAQHIAAELVSRFEFDRPGLPAIALTTDTSMLTAIGNDYGYDRIFVRQLEANGYRGDVFIGISTSGNSSNVLKAVDECSKLGIKTVGLTGDGGQLPKSCGLAISIPSNHTPRIQECHILVGHILCDLIESELFEEACR